MRGGAEHAQSHRCLRTAGQRAPAAARPGGGRLPAVTVTIRHTLTQQKGKRQTNLYNPDVIIDEVRESCQGVCRGSEETGRWLSRVVWHSGGIDPWRGASRPLHAWLQEWRGWLCDALTILNPPYTEESYCSASLLL